MNTIKIKGMSCGHCTASVTKALESIVGTSDVQVDLDHGEASFNGEVDRQVIKDAITAIGFEVVE